MPSAMRKEYASLPKGGNVQRSRFDIGRKHITTMDGNYLVPIHWDWVWPSDVITGDYDVFLRASAPLEFPLFDDIKITVHTFFCALRNLWDNGRAFMGERYPDPDSSIDYTIPEYGNSSNRATDATSLDNQLLRYLEVPIQTAAQGGVDEADVSAIPFRGYYEIFDWHYRDARQQNSLNCPKDDGPDSTTTYTLQTRGKRHDYFTSLLASPQSGDSVTIGGNIAADVGTGGTPGINATSLTSPPRLLDHDASFVNVSSTAATDAQLMYPDTTINELRNAAILQQFLERENRYGVRYDEQLYAVYGSEFNDVRIAPVYLGGGSGYISTTSIPNNSGSTGELGDLAAIATGSLRGGNFTYAVDEPGIVMAIANVSADISYHQGLPKKHSIRTRYDTMIPLFAGVGDEAVEMKELYYQNDVNDETVMGYNPRMEWARTSYNRVSGEFDPNDPSTLEVMHLAEDLGSQPVLGDTWIKQSTPFDRILRTVLQHHFLCDFRINWKVARQLPVHGVPGITRL